VIHLSFSEMKLFKTCPAKHAFKKADTPIPEHRQYRSRAGEVLMATAEAFYKEGWWKDIDTAQFKAREYAIAKLAEVECDEESRLVVLDTAPRIVQAVKEHKLLGVRNFIETELVMEILPGVMLHGRPDFVIEGEDGAYTVLDGKAGGTFGRHADTDQLRIYTVLVEFSGRVRVARAGFWWFRHERVEWKRMAKALPKVQALVARTVEGLARGETAARPGNHCVLCDYKGPCGIGTHWLAAKGTGAVALDGSGFQELEW
jgi:hypothetical protein